MKLATWNVNSLKVRLPQVIDWLQTNQPDMLCLQETKLTDENFPAAEIAAVGYESIFTGQKTYNGVAILSKQKGSEIITAIPGFEDEQKRVVAVTYGDMRVISAYVPNGDTVESEKYQYKLRWLPSLTGWLQQELKNYKKLAILGDFNIAPEDRDVYDPQLWQGKVLCSQPERAAFGDLLKLGLTDSFRLFEQAEKSYTWWDYRMMAFRLNRGLRIDHILLSDALASVCTSCTVDKAVRKLERPSDHAPVVTELSA
ncbi:exodeoxyribonuclease III [Nitrosomonas sp. Is35]|uniref:exodeoxyribonuclease III n=1 Tax=Nitrosomonas sp. Is35 TaxID=3080534 RepID=UPI00294AF167|nr:exodeoxyribonuclease III [Nitrosomonas sp. Is35]MDV6347528.1 exodeoxyribonuclease III [Nitrosomonas sp. Is35]